MAAPLLGTQVRAFAEHWVSFHTRVTGTILSFPQLIRELGRQLLSSDPHVGADTRVSTHAPRTPRTCAAVALARNLGPPGLVAAATRPGRGVAGPQAAGVGKGDRRRRFFSVGGYRVPSSNPEVEGPPVRGCRGSGRGTPLYRHGLAVWGSAQGQRCGCRCVLSPCSRLLTSLFKYAAETMDLAGAAFLCLSYVESSTAWTPAKLPELDCSSLALYPCELGQFTASMSQFPQLCKGVTDPT
ncbi:uncharacterized protein isoform X1 [Macaca fascicularis]|uniref:uncharacterized protein isoform X1 n=1 Tax=Macaca fascicularis TaxID=9541 RepID=UPI003D15D875